MSQDLQEQHDFDGIEELDNDLPRWWLGIFWVTIGFAVFYVPYYHWLHPEKLPEAALEAEQARIMALREASSPAADASVDPLVALEKKYAAGDWKAGAQASYTTYCLACHAVDGGGGIGPNFTDDYYLHGGQLTDIIKVITDGVPEKGMVPWKGVLKPEQIEGLAFFIRDLRGKTAANPKEPQGKQVDEAGKFLEP